MGRTFFERPGDVGMSLHVCRCCGERMTQSSPRNPNICASCEPVLEDDCAELDKLMMSVAAAEAPAHSPPRPSSEDAAAQTRETFSSPV